ncbi:HNH endonuclease [Derxia lacustris]|uniref:HNH endonuclease n=1 Tax=Derxia lacustris TaxID=764842 RepID=UPI001C38B1B4|nr:HNH endonuclease [Derxia lacustris]
MKLITSKKQIAENLITFNSYRDSHNTYRREFFYERLRLGKIFVYGIVKDKFLFSPSRFADYINCSAEKHDAFSGKDGKQTTPTITKHLGKPADSEDVENAYLSLCAELEISPSNKRRTYWLIELDSMSISTRVFGGNNEYPDEVEKYVEGATKRVIVNAYERSSEARAACLNHHGYDCVVCGFNFESKFGAKIGAKFIHVHHLTPISRNSQQHKIDPINELRPVCPNCHAMLHRSDPPFSIEELREILDSSNTTNKP